MKEETDFFGITRVWTNFNILHSGGVQRLFGKGRQVLHVLTRKRSAKS